MVQAKKTKQKTNKEKKKRFVILGNNYPTWNAHPLVICEFLSMCASWCCFHVPGIYSAAKLLSSLSLCLLVCFKKVAVRLKVLESISAPICPSLCSKVRPRAPSILPCTDYIIHSYAHSKRGLLKDCCWANCMTVWVIWKLPTVRVVHYWQWCSRRLYDSGKSLVNLFLLFRCYLCADEATESAFVCSGLYLCWLRGLEGAPLGGDTDVTKSRAAEAQLFAEHQEAVLFLHHGSLLLHLKMSE